MFTVRTHNGAGLRPVEFSGVADLQNFWRERERHPLWLDIESATTDELRTLAEICGFHHLSIEDTLNPEHQPKIDEYEGYLFIVFRSVVSLSDETIQPERGGFGHFQTTKLSVYLGKGFLVTIHRADLAAVHEVGRIVDLRDTTLDHHLDQVLHAIVDRMIDGVFPALDEIEDKIQGLEESIFSTPDKLALPMILKTKRELLSLRRIMSSQREMLARLSRRDDLPYIEAKAAIYFRDVFDHATRIEEMAIVLTDLATGIAEAHLAVTSNRMNEIIKFLTIFSTVWMPLTFIVGVYGMNFDFLPELHWRWSYPLVWLLMVGVAAGMLAFFRRKKWL
jgi:magnesium transporter